MVIIRQIKGGLLLLILQQYSRHIVQQNRKRKTRVWRRRSSPRQPDRPRSRGCSNQQNSSALLPLLRSFCRENNSSACSLRRRTPESSRGFRGRRVTRSRLGLGSLSFPGRYAARSSLSAPPPVVTRASWPPNAGRAPPLPRTPSRGASTPRAGPRRRAPRPGRRPQTSPATRCSLPAAGG